MMDRMEFGGGVDFRLRGNDGKGRASVSKAERGVKPPSIPPWIITGEGFANVSG